MDKIKSPSVAGTFYSAEVAELTEQIAEFKRNSQNDYEYKSRAVIVPHAGLVYSGRLAFDGLKSLRHDLKTLFIFAPAHRVGFDDLALSSYDFWQTPLGNVEVNQKINSQLKENFEAEFFDKAFEQEHSAEIQLPLIQSLYGDINIVPVLVGDADFEIITKIIEFYWQDEKTGFVISSDLSHFLKDPDAVKIDNHTAEMIETGELRGFEYQQACGALGILGLVNFANTKKYSLIRVGLINSSHATGDKSSVVGYGSWFLYEGQKNEFLKTYFSDTILEVCKNSISAGLEGAKTKLKKLPGIFSEKGACFVTLEKNGQLRGCIGSIIAHLPLIDDLVQNAQSAAFKDPRFEPLQRVEFADLSISVSLLSSPEKMNFKDEADLLAQIVPDKDGIIIKDGRYQAVYLPSVWEQLPDKKEFFTSLKIKAGMRGDYFSQTFEAYRFRSEYVE